MIGSNENKSYRAYVDGIDFLDIDGEPCAIVRATATARTVTSETELETDLESGGIIDYVMPDQFSGRVLFAAEIVHALEKEITRIYRIARGLDDVTADYPQAAKLEEIGSIAFDVLNPNYTRHRR